MPRLNIVTVDIQERQNSRTITLRSVELHGHCTVSWNSRKSTRSFHRKKTLFPMRTGVSGRANEWVQWSARAKHAVWSQQMSERGTWMSKRTSGCPRAHRISDIVILLTVHRALRETVTQGRHHWGGVFRDSDRASSDFHYAPRAK